MLTDQEGRSVFAKGQVATSYLLNASSPWSRKAHISAIFVHEGGLSRGKDSAHVLEPYQKGETAPTQLSFCSFNPLLRPRFSARLFICPSACSASSRFRVALSARFSPLLLRAHLSARSEPSRSRLVPAPSGIWLLRFAPALAPLSCLSPVSHSRNFGSLEPAFFPAPSAPSRPFSRPALPYTPGLCSAPVP